MIVMSSIFLIAPTFAFFENKRWISDVSDGAVLVPLAYLSD